MCRADCQRSVNNKNKGLSYELSNKCQQSKFNFWYIAFLAEKNTHLIYSNYN